MEAINNVMFDYQRSGSRHTTGVQDHKDEAAKMGYAFQFISDIYLGNPKRPAIEAVMKHGVHAGVKAHADNPGLIHLADTAGHESGMEAAKAQAQKQPLFASPAPVAAEDAETVTRAVLEKAGCSHVRDTVDARIVEDVKARKFGPVIKSQEDVGGWPELK